MNEFLKFLSEYPIVIKMLIILFILLLFFIISLFTIAFLQGREISFWPPKIGTMVKEKEQPKRFIEKITKPIFKEDDITIKINIPQNGDRVSQFSDVEYEIERQLPEGYRPVLLIRDPLGQYWSWGTIPTGSYKRVQFGLLEDSGKQFEVGILITNLKVPLGQPTQIIPKGIAYESVIVIRR